MPWSQATTQKELRALYVRLLPRLRRIAKENGYALGLHGSMRRDLDLIAVPWTKKAARPERLAERLQLGACGFRTSRYEWEKKPHGRRAVALIIGRKAYIDLSVVPFQLKT